MTRKSIEDVQRIEVHRMIEIVKFVNGKENGNENESGNVKEAANDVKIDMMIASETAGIHRHISNFHRKK